MSFLADDEFSTLEAALAFIDSYQDRSIDVLAAASRAPAPATATTHALPAPPVTPPSTTTSGSESADADADSEGSPRSDERSEDGEPQGDAVVRRRKARNALASARSHRKKREELLLLREQETLLQAQLDALKARQQTTSGTQSLLTAMQAAGGVDGREGAVVPAGGAQLLPSAHFDLALHEHRRRQKSEALNRRLRTALRKQRSLSQHFSQHIHKRLEFKDVMEVLQLSERSRSALSPVKVNPRTPNASRIAVQKEAILDELMVKMRQQFREADAACEIAALDESSSSNMQVKQHPQFGAYVEITCSTPLGCTVEEAWEEFYGSMCVMKAEHANDYTFKMSVIDDQSSEKEYSISFEDKARFGVVPIDGVTLVQQFKAPDYVMYMFMSVIRPQLDGIQFRECGFIAMTRSALDPRRCIYRQQYQLFSDGPQDAGEASVALKNFLLNSLASKMRKDQRRLEDSLLQRFNASLPLVPPLA